VKNSAIFRCIYALVVFSMLLMPLSSCRTGTSGTTDTSTGPLSGETTELDGTSSVTTADEETTDGTTTKAEGTTAVPDTTKAPDTTNPPLTETVYKTAENASKLKIIGRSSTLSTGITSDWSASGIEFSAVCKDKVKVKVNAAGSTYYTVYVDGERQSKRFFASGATELTIAQDLPEGLHTFRILKQSHVYHSLSVIESITVKGSLSEPPSNKKHYIEFIGDSITCGYGVIFDKLETGINYGTYEYADATSAFGFLTAEALDADWSLFSVSGWGISCNDVTIPQIYDKTNWRRNTTAYSFSRKADLVIINLGTNDYSKSITAEKFKEDAKAFITSIKQKNNNPSIVWVYNMMNDGHATAIKQTIFEMGGEGAGLYTLSLVRDRNGGGNHPSLAGHNTAASTLTAFIKSKNLLK